MEKRTLTTGSQILEVKCVTWSKDSHNLFDYESNTTNQKKSRQDSSFKIFREKDEVFFTDKDHIFQSENFEQLVQVRMDDNKQFFIQPNPDNIKSELEQFLIVRSLKNKDGVQKGYSLQLNDLVKLGRIEYCVIEKQDLNLDRKTVPELFCSVFFKIVSQKKESQYKLQINENSSEILQCKICLQEGLQNLTDPFINLCLCKGTTGYTHFACLKEWIDSKVQKKLVGNTVSYKYKNLTCEICKTSIPKRILINDREFQFVEIERPQLPYILLEQISREKTGSRSKGLFLVHSFEGETTKMGRGHQCDIRISDISVSRLHAQIIYQDGNFLITDHNSKFGTLVKLRNEYKVTQDKIAIQIGRTVLTFVIKNLNQFDKPSKSRQKTKQLNMEQEVSQNDQAQQNLILQYQVDDQNHVDMEDSGENDKLEVE